MKENDYPYKRQIFVCTNDREGVRESCGDFDGFSLFKKLRNRAKEEGLHPHIRVAQAKCLGQCKNGPNVMIYPDNVWYSHVDEKDIEEIIQRFISREKTEE